MPYIGQERRKRFDPYVRELIMRVRTPGDANYIITTFIRGWLDMALDYSRINMMIGVLECVKLELYRRVVSGYEDEKIKENGDIE